VWTATIAAKPRDNDDDDDDDDDISYYVLSYMEYELK